MVKIELDIKGISWYIETTLETDTVPAVGDIIIVDKDCISERDSAELWKTPSNQVFKWADEEDDAPVMVWFDIAKRKCLSINGHGNMTSRKKKPCAYLV